MAQKNGTRVAAKARAYRALEMKVAGATDRQIAETEGVSAALINRDIKRVIGELATNGNAAINADEIRFIQMERLNKIILANWPGALQGDKDATERVLKAMAQLNQICGLIPDKPLISMNILQQSLQVNQAPFTFEIEVADDSNPDIQEAKALQETI